MTLLLQYQLVLSGDLTFLFTVFVISRYFNQKSIKVKSKSDLSYSIIMAIIFVYVVPMYLGLNLPIFVYEHMTCHLHLAKCLFNFYMDWMCGIS